MVIRHNMPDLNTPTHTNKLHFGDNLPILRHNIPDESVDLIYLDPPFNSNATYNVLFREHDSSESATPPAPTPRPGPPRKNAVRG